MKPSCFATVFFIVYYMTEEKMKAENTGSRLKQFMLTICAIIIISIFVVTVCSKSSPIYPLNDWDDPNCFFTVGKAMANGKVLYRDIFEQKGPLLYMLHELTYFISQKTFLGVYFAEVIACAAFLIFSYKIISLFTDKHKLLIVFPLAAFTYTSLSFCSGDSAEELCLPFLCFSFYTALSCIKRNKLMSLKNALLCGICTGVILWVKFTMLGFFIGFILSFVIIYIRQKQYKKILSCALAVISGVIISSLPVIIYCFRTDSFNSLFEVYFYDNMFLYSTGSALPPVIKQIVNLFSGLVSFAAYNTFGFIFLVFGFVYSFRKEKTEFRVLFSMTAASTFLFSFIGGRAYAYYPYVMMVFVPVGLTFLSEILRSKIKLRKPYPAVIISIISMLAVLFLCRNTYLIFTPEDDLPQFRFAAIMEKTKDPTLLNYGFLDGGFYTVSGIVPDCRYFCELNVELDEMYETQKEYAEKGRVKYIVTKDEKPDFVLYELIDKCESVYWTQTSTYYLYKLKSI